MRPRFSIWFEGLSSPERFSIFGQALVLLFGVVVLWIVSALILSVLGCWVVFPSMMVLFWYTGMKSYRQSRSETWANEGRCAACGHDLAGIPLRCPECGRDATLDEPAWRRMRRMREALLLQPGAKIPTADENRQRLLAPIPLEDPK